MTHYDFLFALYISGMLMLLTAVASKLYVGGVELTDLFSVAFTCVVLGYLTGKGF